MGFGKPVGGKKGMDSFQDYSTQKTGDASEKGQSARLSYPLDKSYTLLCVGASPTESSIYCIILTRE